MLDSLPAEFGDPPEPPESPVGFSLCLMAFQALGPDRSMIPGGMGPPMPGRIPWSALDRWARRYGVSGPDFELFARVVMEMDTVYLEHTRKAATL